MAIFDKKDKSLLDPSLFSTAQVVVDEPKIYPTDVATVATEPAEYTETQSKSGSVIKDPDGFAVQTKEVAAIKSSDNAVNPSADGVYEMPTATPGLTDTKNVVAQSQSYDIQRAQGKLRTPTGYAVKEYDYYTEGVSSVTGDVHIDRTWNKLAIRDIVVDEDENGNKTYSYTSNKGGKSIGINTNPIIDDENGAVYINGVNYSRSGSVDLQSPSMKSLWYEYASSFIQGNTNFDRYNTSSVRGIIDMVNSNIGLGSGFMKAVNGVENIWNHGKGIVDAIKKDGFKGFLNATLAWANEATPVPVQSEAIVPAVNALLNSIPIVNIFTKKKYSLDCNKNTYAHEEVYNIAANRKKKILEEYEGGMYGLYWYAKFYSNHGVPAELVERVIGRLAGNPKYSKPTHLIFDGIKGGDYLKTIGDANKDDNYLTAKASPAVMVNMTDFTRTQFGTGRTITSDGTAKDGKALNFKEVFNNTRLNQTVDPKTKRIDPFATNGKVDMEFEKGKKFKISSNPNGSNRAGDFVVPMIPIPTAQNANIKQKSVAKSIVSGWTDYVLKTMGINGSGQGTTNTGFIYVNPKELSDITQIQDAIDGTASTIGVINNVHDYEKYRHELSEAYRSISNQEMKPTDPLYGYYPYKWSQVFRNFEISSSGNWNVAFSEFTGNNASASKFVPKNRPTYGKWHYMPIISYEFMDKDLNSTSIPVSECLNLQIPQSNSFVSTLQVTFIDDRFDRIFNWFCAYSNSIYGVFDGFVKPYKNCCLRCVIDILDWDRTILKRMVYAVTLSHFSQQYVGEGDHSYKTVSVTFSVVGEVHPESPSKTYPNKDMIPGTTKLK